MSTVHIDRGDHQGDGRREERLNQKPCLDDRHLDDGTGPRVPLLKLHHPGRRIRMAPGVITAKGPGSSSAC